MAENMENTKKELGQHWLKDLSILTAIADAADLQPDDHVLEIGPGLGTLTKVIVQKCQVTALEFDRDLIAGLSKQFSGNQKVEILQGDVRTFDFTAMQSGYKIVANIPYYLTSHLIRSISETSNPPALAVLLIQKEVAERLCAEPGEMSILAITAQFYFECSLDIEVSAHFFTPPPKVDSQVVILRRRPQTLFNVDVSRFFRLIKAGFSEKRKTLRNSLSGGLHISKQEAETILSAADINFETRAQQLSLEEWYRLYQALDNLA